MTLRALLFSLVIVVATPQASYAISCHRLFAKSQSQAVASTFEENLKSSILQDALSKTKIKLTSDKVYIEQIIKRWNLEDSTPAKMESIAQALVFKADKKGTLIEWLREIILKGEPLKEATRVRAETLVLKRELIEGLKTRGLYKENSKLDNYHHFRLKYFNTVQLAKFLVINSVIINYLGVPLYLPTFDWIKNLDLKSEDLDLVQSKGFENSYSTLIDRYKVRLGSQKAIEYAPHVFFLSVATYTVYNYLKFEATESRYEVSTTDVRQFQIPYSHSLFKAWQVSFEERMGRKPDMNNPQDVREWKIMSLTFYQAWADLYKEKNGRLPNLSKEKDRLAWEEFLSSVEY